MASEAAHGIPKGLAHVAIRVTDVDRAVRFYTEVVGLKVRNRGRGVAFLGIRADTSHELALFPLPEGAEGPDPKRVGMYHMAWEMDSFEELERLHQRLLAHGARIAGYADGQCNVMFLDPDGNELEAIWEPSEEERERLRAPGGPGLPRLPR
jgi:catechol-2,3-dioxygenase